MGLDMYLRGEKFFWTNWEDPTKNRLEDGLKVNTVTVELGYWRKHPNLHGRIVKTFAGGVDECQRIDLAKDDLKTLIMAVKAQDLPHTEGFFFGKSDNSDDELNEDLKLLEAALEWAKTEEKGVSRSVYYKASW